MRKGFTLLEMLAVVTIIALVAMMVVPGLGRVGEGDLDEEAHRLAAGLELARQRAVATGIPHRVHLDLEYSAWRVEWFVTEARAQGLPEPESQPLDLRGQGPLPLAAPREAERAFYPVPDEFGRSTRLADDVLFESVETPGGSLSRGDVSVEFDRDGTAQAAGIRLGDERGRVVRVEVRPLAEAVRVVDDGL